MVTPNRSYLPTAIQKNKQKQGGRGINCLGETGKTKGTLASRGKRTGGVERSRGHLFPRERGDYENGESEKRKREKQMTYRDWIPGVNRVLRQTEQRNQVKVLGNTGIQGGGVGQKGEKGILWLGGEYKSKKKEEKKKKKKKGKKKRGGGNKERRKKKKKRIGKRQTNEKKRRKKKERKKKKKKEGEKEDRKKGQNTERGRK